MQMLQAVLWAEILLAVPVNRIRMMMSRINRRMMKWVDHFYLIFFLSYWIYWENFGDEFNDWFYLDWFKKSLKKIKKIRNIQKNLHFYLKKTSFVEDPPTCKSHVKKPQFFEQIIFSHLKLPSHTREKKIHIIN